MSAIRTASGLLADFSQRGFVLRPASDKIVVTPASRLTPADRDAIGRCRAELLAILSPCETWNAATALRLMAEADALVERLGVSGQHPEVADAAAMVVNARATRDMGTLRFAIAEFRAVVGRLAPVMRVWRATSPPPTYTTELTDGQKPYGEPSRQMGT